MTAIEFSMSAHSIIMAQTRLEFFGAIIVYTSTVSNVNINFGCIQFVTCKIYKYIYVCEVWQKSKKTNFLFTYVLFFSNINVIPFKIVPLGSYTPDGDVVPTFGSIAGSLQHVRYTNHFWKAENTVQGDLQRLQAQKKGHSHETRRCRQMDAPSWQRPMSHCPHRHRIFDLKMDSCGSPDPYSPDHSSCELFRFPKLKMPSKDVISGL